MKILEVEGLEDFIIIFFVDYSNTIRTEVNAFENLKSIKVKWKSY